MLCLLQLTCSCAFARELLCLLVSCFACSFVPVHVCCACGFCVRVCVLLKNEVKCRPDKGILRREHSSATCMRKLNSRRVALADARMLNSIPRLPFLSDSFGSESCANIFMMRFLQGHRR